MSSAVTITPEDIVKVVNNDPVPLDVMWNSKKFRLEPGRDQFIPAACAFNWFGDPRSTNIYQSIQTPEGMVYFVPDRLSEVRRLRIKYGAGLGGDETTLEGIPVVPQVEVWTAGGDRVLTVLDDPAGDSVTPALITTGSEAETRKLIASQQRQIDELMKLNGMTASDGEAATEDELPPDSGDLTSLLDNAGSTH